MVTLVLPLVIMLFKIDIEPWICVIIYIRTMMYLVQSICKHIRTYISFFTYRMVVLKDKTSYYVADIPYQLIM